MSETDRSWKKITTFVVLTFVISSFSYWMMLRTGSARRVCFYWMWSPALGAILTQLLFRESLRDFGWSIGPKKYVFWGLMIPPLYALVIYGIAWATGLAGFVRPTFVLFCFLPLGLAIACLAALGEEIGWRGLLAPELLKVTTFTKASFVTWIIWAVWHYPAIIFGDYHSQAPRWFDLTTLTVAVLGVSFSTNWLRAKSGSLWPAVLWHGAHNFYIQGLFLEMTSDVGPTEYIVDDFGVGVMLATLVLGYVFWRRRLELPQALHLQSEKAG